MTHTWTVFDFIMIWLGGLFGSALVFAAADAINAPYPGVFGLGGQYLATFALIWILGRKKEDADFGWGIEPKDTLYLGLGIGLQFVIAPLMAPLVRQLFPDGEPVQNIAGTISDPDISQFLRTVLILTAVLFAPLIEEIVFRGVLLRALRRRGKTVAIVASAIIFAAVHLADLRTDRFFAAVAVAIPPLLILGAVLAWITLRTGRIGPAIFLHSGWNLLAVLVLMIPEELLEQLG